MITPFNLDVALSNKAYIVSGYLSIFKILAKSSLHHSQSQFSTKFMCIDPKVLFMSNGTGAKGEKKSDSVSNVPGTCLVHCLAISAL